MKRPSTGQLTLTAVSAAAVFAATFFLRFPTPVGYLNAGDGVVLLAGALFGPFAGAFAGAVGSALADVAGGYALYAPVSALVKGVAGLLMGFAPRKRRFPVSLLAELLVLLGYFLLEWFLFGKLALVTLFANALQAAVGVLLCFVGTKHLPR